jgi:hypothetical protein
MVKCVHKKRNGQMDFNIQIYLLLKLGTTLAAKASTKIFMVQHAI